MEESAALSRGVGDRWSLASTLNFLAEVAEARGEHGRAARFLEESLELRRDLGDRGAAAQSLCSLGRVADAQQDYDRAAEHFGESLNARKNLGQRGGVADCLEGLAGVAEARRRPGRAARLFGAAEAIREAISAPRHALDQAAFETHAARARAQLEDKAFTGAWAEGRSMNLDRAVAYALDDAIGT